MYPLHAGENDLRFPGNLHRLEIPLAAAAVAAHRRVLLPEVIQNVAPQTAFRLAVADHGVQPFQILPPHLLPLHGVHFLVVGAVVDKEPGGLHVSGTEQQNAVRLCPVPSGAPGLLIVGFDAFRHIVVNDKADVGFVDAHAESVCCHHHGLAVVQEILLIFASLGFGKPRVIPGGGVTVVMQQLANALHLFPGGAVDDAAFPLLPGKQTEKRFVLGLRLDDFKIQVRTVKSRDLPHRTAQLQNPLHILLHAPGRGGGERPNHRALRKAVDKLHDSQIAGAEILSPLGDAVGFVHRDKGYVQLLHHAAEARIVQPFRGDIDDLVPPGQQIAVCRLHLRSREGAVQKRGGNARRLQRHHLIPHQGDQGRDDQSNSRQHQRRELVAHAFSAAGGHDAEYVLPGKHAVNELLLPRPEAGIAKDPLQ